MMKKYTLAKILCPSQHLCFTAIKNKTFFGVLLAFFMVSSALVSAQTIVPALNPNGPTPVNDPFGSFWDYERSAMIYTPAQIGTTGNISQVGFYVNSISGAKDAVNVRIYMKERTTLMTSTTPYATEITGATLVYGPTTIPAANFIANDWTSVTLTTPFNYSGGLNNLEIIVETNAAGIANRETLETNKQFRTSTMPSIQYYQYWNNNDNAPTGSGTRKNYRPNVQLTFSCFAPTAVTASSITGSSASIGFTSTVANYIVEHGPTGFTPGTGATAGAGGTITTGTISPITISGLSPTSNYDVYVRAVCVGSTYSLNSTKTSFSTTCGEIPITVTEGFNSGSLPLCWKKVIAAGSSASLITFPVNGINPTTYPYEGSNMVQFNSWTGTKGTEERLETIPMSSIGTTSVDVEFYFRRGADIWASSSDLLNEGVQVQYSLDGTSWTNAGAFIPRYSTTVSGWELQTITIPTAVGNKTSFYIGFKFRSEYHYYMFLDKAVIKPTSPPITITSSVPLPVCAGTAASLTAASTEAYTYTWSPATGLNTTIGATVIATPTVSTVYTVTGVSGLFTGTQKFEVVVNPMPNDVDITANNSTVCANTIQTLVATGGSLNTIVLSENFNAGGLPSGWTRSNVSGNGQDFYSTSEFDSGGNTWTPSNAGNGGVGHCMYGYTFLTSSGVDVTLETPAINLSTLSNATLSFYLFNNSGSDVMKVFAKQGANAYTQVNAISYGVYSSWTLITINLNSFAGTGNNAVKIKFQMTSDYGSSNYAIDDVQVSGLGQSIIWSPNTNLFTNLSCTVPYNGTSHASTLYAQPSSTITYTATSTIGSCTKSDSVTFTVGGTSVYAAGNWSASPTGNTSLVFNGNYSGTGNLTGCDCKVNSPAVVTIASGDVMSLENELVVTGGSITFENNSSLLQKNNVTNTGNITYKRTANLKKMDYVYWSSPLIDTSNFSTALISPLTPAGSIYKWIPTIPGNTNGFGNWTSGVENMVSGKGYIVRGPNNFSDVAAPHTAAFVGTPANGNINSPMARGSYDGINYSTGASSTLGTKDDDNWNLIGNPYPSAIKALDFLSANINSVEGFIQIWTHGTPPSTAIADPFYNDYVYNYTSADYITYNSLGASSGPGTYNGLIPAGQGFFVLVKHTSGTPTPNAAFNNSMRSASYNNSQFFRNAQDEITNDEGRMWLDLIAPNGENIRTLVGYKEEATYERDDLFDAIADRKLSLDVYSTIDEEQMRIQGRMIPFDDNDRVPLGIKVPQSGNYSIAIGAVDGLFSSPNQNIYLKDLENNFYHDLKSGPYHFTASNGETNTRFEIVYRNGTLGNDDFSQLETIKVMVNNQVTIESSEMMQEVIVYNVLGQVLARYTNIADTKVTLTSLQKSQKTLLLKIKLDDGRIVNRKIIF